MKAGRDIFEATSALAKMVTYNSETGLFMWADVACNLMPSRRRSKLIGKECGALDVDGYIRISFSHNGHRYGIRSHRLAWFMVMGRHPSGEIDHINRNTTDNRICNLRDVSASTNQRNRSINSNNASGVSGVHFMKSAKKWRAIVRVNSKATHIGLFDEIDAAEQAVKNFRAAHGFSDSHGDPRPSSAPVRIRTKKGPVMKELAEMIAAIGA